MTGIVVEEIEVIEHIILSGSDERPADLAARTGEEELAFQQAALIRVQQGSNYMALPTAYRLCTGCGKPLPAMRLRVIPNAVLCVMCKEDEERIKSLYNTREACNI